MNQLAPPARRYRPQIAVIGGGFSGAAFAMHLLRDFPELGVRITIFEPRAKLGAGLAYSTPQPECRVNVSAARMAMFPDDPTHFDRWWRASGRLAADPQAEVEGVGAFPRRADFGDYMLAQLQFAADAAPRATLRHVRARAAAITEQGGSFLVALQDGTELGADVVVLATGHPATEVILPLRALASDPGLIADPWADGALAQVGPGQLVLIVGTGLTMADVVASLRARGHRAPIVAVSRRGLLPRVRTTRPVTPAGEFSTPPSRSATELLRRVRSAIADGVAAGEPWEATFDALRGQARAVWAALPHTERRRLLRHAQPFWDVHRYQCAPQIDALLRHDLARGHLRLIPARIRSARRGQDGMLQVALHPRGSGAETQEALTCDIIITCTGPGHRSAIGRNPALHSLAQVGLIQPDPYGLGLAVDDEGRAIGVSQDVHPALLVVGPPARGTWGELMGLPQVSTQPREVAAGLARRLDDPSFLTRQEAVA